jgi:RNA polymerase sigma factor (sigma-70 family)
MHSGASGDEPPAISGRPLTAAERRDVEDALYVVRAMVGRQVAGMPPHLRDDLHQVALEAVCRARMRWVQGVAKFSTYAVFRAQGAVRDYLRDQRHGTRGHPEPDPISLDEPVSAHGDRDDTLSDLLEAPEHDHGHLELLHEVATELKRMPEPIARTFRLVALDGRRLQDVADSDGVTESAISQRIHRARALLQPLAAAA